MKYDLYEAFSTGTASSDVHLDSKKTSEEDFDIFKKIGEESKNETPTNSRPELNLAFEMYSVNNPSWTFSLEEEDPFAGIGEDSTTDAAGGDDNPFGDDGGGDDPFGGGDDGGDSNPFDFDSADDSSDDFFSSDDTGDDGDGEKKPKKIKLNRKDIIDDEYNINTQIRKEFPTYFLKLKDTIKSNMDIVEKTIIDDSDHIELFDMIATEYKRIAKVVDDYLLDILDKPHDDIFTTYSSIVINLQKLKSVYEKILTPDNKTGKSLVESKIFTS